MSERLETQQTVTKTTNSEQTVTVALYHIGGGEPVTLTGLSPQQFNVLADWYKGVNGQVIDIPVGEDILFLNRSLVTYIVAKTEQGE